MAIGRVPGATGIQPSIVDAKGDLIAATAADSVSRLAAGSNNQVLMADSAQATGLKYANEATATLTTTGDILYASAANTPARLAIGSTDQVLKVSGGIPAWGAAPTASFEGTLVYNSTAISCTSGAWTTLTANSESYDVGGYHSTSSNTERLTVPTGKAGYYYIYLWGDFENNNAVEWIIRCWDSAADIVFRLNQAKTTGNRVGIYAGGTRYLSDNDYIYFELYQASGTSQSFEITGTYGGFGMYRIGA